MLPRTLRERRRAPPSDLLESWLLAIRTGAIRGGAIRHGAVRSGAILSRTILSGFRKQGPFLVLLAGLCWGCAAAPVSEPAPWPSPAGEAKVSASLQEVGAVDRAANPEEPGADVGELAKKTQNPVSDLISVPFQNNFNFGFGHDDDLLYVLNIQPVYPMSVNEEWSIIHRPIIPIIDQPEIVPGFGDEFGLGDIQYQAYLAPAEPGKVIWGVGPVLQFPTASDDVLGTEQWAAGPGAVVLRMDGPWVYGALANNIWSYAGDDDRADVNQMLVQPFVNYNLPGGWYVSSAPIITANWEADRGGDTWTVPLGVAGGKVLRLGKLPVSVSLGAYYNVAHPDIGPDWSARLQFSLLFPKSK
ncbi:MAG: neuromedin U [Planctomycetota bacterium]